MYKPKDAAHPSTSPPTPVGTGLRLLLPIVAVLVLLLLVLGMAATGLRWLMLNEDGSRWLLARLPMVQVQGWRGALLGESWHADRLRVEWAKGKQWLVLEDLQADGMRWQWRPSETAWLGLQVSRLAARRFQLDTGPAGARPIVLPADFAPPLLLAVGQTRVGELQIGGLPVWRDAAMDGFTMDPAPAGELRAESLSFETKGLAIAGAVRLGHVAPLALNAHATVRPQLDGDAPRWAAVVDASGSVTQLQLAATLRGVPVATPATPAAAKSATGKGRAPVAAPAAPARTAPALDLQLSLQPLQAWALAGLNAQTQSLDLAALWPGAPSTRLSGQAELKGGAKGLPLTAAVRLDNALPGRWNEGRIPVQGLHLEARGDLAQRDRIDLTRFDIALADASGSAGRLSGTALWQDHEIKLDTRLANVAPQRLDGRAASMSLTGPLALTLRGLPSPDFAAAKPTPTPPQSLRWKLDLQGKLDAAPQPVQLQLEGEMDDQHVAFTQARATAGAASADLRASLTREAAGSSWRLQSTGKVQDFDPVAWVPGDVGSAWRKGPHRLSGEWQLDTRLPAAGKQPLQPLEFAQRLAGNGRLSIRDSLLAGVPLAAEITLGYSQKLAPVAGTLRAEVRLGGNQIVLDGRGDPAGSGEADRWHIEVRGDNLAALAPLARLDPALASWVPRQGNASAVITAQGRWPGLQTEGTVRLAQLQIGDWSLARGAANWRMDIRPEARNEARTEGRGEQPLSLQLELVGVQMGKQRADNLHAEVLGTLASHRIDISGALPLSPPPIVEQVLGIQLQSGTRVQMQAQGAWRAESAGGGRWQAQIAQLQVGSWDGSPDAAASASAWAQARDLKAELRFDARGQLLSIQADPGRVRLADTATLRWDAVRIELPAVTAETTDMPPQIQLRADIEPFALAPLLARAQPAMGWRGDLRLSARLNIRAAEKVDADLVFERTDGDLHAASAEGVQLLGLTEFKLALAAHEGVWNFTQSFRGRSLGEIDGELRVQTTPERRWPQASAPISGKLQLRVADIGIWGSWVPPGWHLGGEVRANAALGGTFGAPEYTGTLTGAGLGVRNLLEGVNVSDGNVNIKLAGTTAEVERFTLKGGDGLLTISGKATFGSAPQARLQIVAEHFRLLGRVDRQLIASGKAELALLPDETRLEGQFMIDEGLFDTSRGDAPSLDEDVAVRRPGRNDEAPAAAAAPPVKRNFVLGLTVDVGENLRVRGRGLDTSLRGQVRMSTPNGRLAVNGTISTEGGTYAAYGQKLEIERGIVAFNGVPGNPRLDVLALRPNIDTRVGVQITGSAQAPRIKLFSEPELSDTDKLAWLVLGRAPDGLGRNDTALLQRAAVALLAGEGEAPTDALMRRLGIDELTLRQGDTDVRETVVSLGKQLSRRWYLGYERGLNATTGTWQLIYRIAQQFTLRLQSGLDSSADVIWTWRLQETPADAAARKTTVQPR